MSFLSSSLSDPPLYWVANLLVQVTVIAIVTLFAAAFLQRHSAIRYRLLFMSMLLVLLCPVITGFVQFTGPRLGLPLLRLSELQLPSFPDWPEVTVHRGTSRSEADSANTAGAAPSAAPAQGTLESDTPQEAASKLPETAQRATGSAELMIEPRFALRTGVILFLAIWVIGAAYLLVRLFVSLRHLKRLIQSASANENDELAMAYRQVWQSIAPGGSRLPDLLLSESVEGPVAAGWRNPKVVLPSSLPTKIGREQLKNVLLHELAHVHRGDQIVVLLQHIMAAIFWIHPCVRVLNQKLAQSREEVCDNFVLHVSNPTDYSRTLLDLAGMMSEANGVPCTVGLFASQWKLEHRIAGLLDSRRNRATQPGAAGRGALAIVAIAMLSIASLSTLAPAQEAGAKIMRFLNSEDPGKDAIGDALPPHAVMRFGTRRFQPSSGTDMVLSPDDSTIITLGGGNIVGTDAATGKQLWSEPWGEYGNHIVGPAYCQRFIAFGKDSSTFATTGQGNQLHIWDTREGPAETIDLPVPANPAAKALTRIDGESTSSVDVTADGKLFAVGGKRGVGIFNKAGERIWFLNNVPKKPLVVDDFNRDRLTSGGDYSTAIFSPDEKSIAALLSQKPKTIKLLNAESGDVIGDFDTPAKPVRMIYSPDGDSLYTTQRDCCVRSYATDTRKLNWEFVLPKDAKGAESYASAIDCTADGKLLAVGMPIGPKYWIYLVDALTGKEVSILKSDMWKPWAVQFTKDGKTLYSNGWDGIVRRWDVATGKELDLPEGIRASDTITISPDGKRVAFTDGRGDVRIVDAKTGIEQTKIKPLKATGGVLLFSPDSQTIHIGGAKGDNVCVESRNIADGKSVNAWQWPLGEDSHSSIEELATTRDGRYLAAAVFRQDAAYIWDTKTGQKTATLKHQEVYGLDFSPDGKTLATVGWDKAMRTWDVAKGEMLNEFQVSYEEQNAAGPFGGGRFDVRMYGIRFSPDGEQVAIAHMGGLAAWDVSDLEDPRRLFLTRGSFTFGALDYSRDGIVIAAGGSRGDVTLYDSQTGESKLKVGKHVDHVYTVRFGDGSRFVSGGGGVSYLWETLD